MESIEGILATYDSSGETRAKFSAAGSFLTLYKSIVRQRMDIICKLSGQKSGSEFESGWFAIPPIPQRARDGWGTLSASVGEFSKKAEGWATGLSEWITMLIPSDYS